MGGYESQNENYYGQQRRRKTDEKLPVIKRVSILPILPLLRVFGINQRHEVAKAINDNKASVGRTKTS